MIKKITKQQIEHFSRLEKLFYRKPLSKVPAFVGTIVILLFLVPDIFGKSAWASHISFILMLFLQVYLTFFIVFLIRHSLKSLFSAKSLWKLLGSYVMFIVSILVLFSFGYSSIENMHKGYLTYGGCSDQFEPSMIGNDSQKANSYFYFSAITLFTVGYGDICPLGWDKWLAVLNSFIGNFISVVLMVLVITGFVNRNNAKGQK